MLLVLIFAIYRRMLMIPYSEYVFSVAKFIPHIMSVYPYGTESLAS